jgi:enoyl-CoA hydratase/carnithine racemase
LPTTVVTEDVEDGVCLVRLDRPERLNALSAEMMADLDETWAGLARRADLRCVVLTGSGRGFCSGADASFLSAERAPRGTGVWGELSFVPGHRIAVPIVVAVNGVCAGGGLHFVADADIVIAGESASFLDPHVSVGQVSGIEPASLALRLPLPVVSRMALLGTAERLSVERAYQLGLVTEVVADENLVTRAVEIAVQVAAASPAAVRATRAVLRAQSAAICEPHMAVGWQAVQDHWAHPDATEGPAAFADRRPPRWADPTPHAPNP